MDQDLIKDKTDVLLNNKLKSVQMEVDLIKDKTDVLLKNQLESL